MLPIILEDEELILLPEKAIFWPKQKTLIVADLHWGKTAHFRKNGIAIPSDTQKRDEQLLAGIISSYKADRLVIAGDLFHSKANKETEDFPNWRRAHSTLHIDLIIGNHDILPSEKYITWNLQIHEEPYLIAPFLIAHNEIKNSRHFIIHGHVHPAIRLSGKGQQSVKLYCFAEYNNSLVMPAFGTFTGTHLINETGYKHVYVVAGTNVLKWE